MGGFGFSSSSSSSSSLPSFRFPSGPSGSSSFFGSEPATIFGPSAPIPTPFGPSSVPATTSIPLFGPPSTGHDTFGPTHPLFGPEDPTFKLSGPSSTPSTVLFGSSNPVSAQPSFFSFGSSVGPAQSSSMVGSTTSTTATTVSSRSSGGGGGGDGFAAALDAQPSLFSFGSSVGPAQSSSMVGSTTSTTTTTVSSCSSGGGFAAALATYSAAMSSGFSAAASSGTITAPVTSSVAVSSTTTAASLASQSEANAALHSVGELPSDRVKMTEEVGNKTSGHSSCASEVFDGYADEFGLSPDFSKQLIPCPQKGLSVQNCHFINQILLKYGDITKGSILKSVEARTTFLKFVAEVVALLSSNTLETIGAHEIETMQNWTDDAASVGFHVEWLQQRIKRVAANSKYRESSVRLNEISEEINAAKLALSKLEGEQMALKKDVDLMETEIDGDEDFRSDLCEGLL